MPHVPVLTTELLELLDPQPGEIAIDCTVGAGGHALELGRRVGPAGRVLGFDLDAPGLERARQRLEPEGLSFVPIHDSFVRVPAHMRRLGLRADALLGDLGFSSDQMDDPQRGLSFARDAPLDMRFDRTQPVTAADLLATLDEPSLADVIHRYGEDPLARKIARNLVRARRLEPIETTTRLASLVVEAYGRRAESSRMHPATRTFMALRIAVNDELAALQSLLEQIDSAAEQTDRGGWLAPGARLAIISFHSLEDRLVKHAFADLVRRGLATRLTGGPVRPSETEIRDNPRARSARLRAVRLTG